MSAGLDLQTVTVTIQGEFFGPDFVRGLALQSDSFDIVSDTMATLQFTAGFNTDITLQQIVIGTGFGYDEDAGRYTGRVVGYYAYEIENPSNGWTFSNLNVSLDVLNNNATNPNVTFPDLLVVPLQYKYVGGEFSDTYILGSFDDIAYGYAGDDQFTGLTGDDTIYGAGGSDILAGNDGNDYLSGGNGRDKLFGGGGADELDGGDGADEMYGGDGDDALDGGEDNDILFGGSGGDFISGGDGEDLIRGGADSDVVLGGANADEIYGGGGDDELYGNGGQDVIRGGDGSDVIRGGGGNDEIYGGAGTNFLYGDGGNDSLTGNSGTDQLFGGDGDDVLSAMGASDFVNGGLGDDTLSANTPGGDFASDTFIFEGRFGNDTITDFEVGFDSIVFAIGIEDGDVTTHIQGEDVLLRVDVDLTAEAQTVLLLGVAETFDLAVDVYFQ